MQNRKSITKGGNNFHRNTEIKGTKKFIDRKGTHFFVLGKKGLLKPKDLKERLKFSRIVKGILIRWSRLSA